MGILKPVTETPLVRLPGAIRWQSLLRRFWWYRCRITATEFPVNAATEDRADFGPARFGRGRAWVGSGETQLGMLPGPVPFKLIVAEQGLCSELGRMTAVQNCLHNLGGQEAQPKHACEV